MLNTSMTGLVSTQSFSAKQNRFERRAHLPLRRDSLWQIQSGVVRTLTYLEDGTIVTLGMWGVGDVVSRLLSQADPYYIECLTPVEVALLPLDQYLPINRALINHIQQLQAFLEILHCRPVDVAMLKLLTLLANRFGREVEQGTLIDFRLTHQEMAEILGTTRVTVTRLLKQFEEQGTIERLARQLILLQNQQALWYYQI